MSVLESYFRRQVDESYDHPLLRVVKDAKNRPEVERVLIEVLRQKDSLGFKPAKLYLHLCGEANRDVQPYQKEDWDDALNSALVDQGIRAISTDNEKVRFALALRAALHVPENRFGDGYFNAVLVHYIENSPFANHPAVKSILEHVYRTNPSPQSYAKCRDQIDTAIRGRAMELVEDLEYPISEAEEILAAAVAQYLDERFSVTNRRLLGFL